MTTCTKSSENDGYMLTNLNGEVGELNSLISKAIRKGIIRIDDNNLQINRRIADVKLINKFSDLLIKELGDILWQLSGLASVLNIEMEDVAKTNLRKLRDRANRNVIIGEGDER